MTSSLVDVGPGADVTISGMRTPCPLCGSAGAIINGNYQTKLDGTAAVSLSPTPAQLIRLQTALAWAQRALKENEADPAAVERKIRKTVEREAPGLASMVDSALGTKSATLAAWIAILLTLLTTIIGSQEKAISPEDVARIVEQIQSDQPDDGVSGSR
jgi:hypothetical protein